MGNLVFKIIMFIIISLSLIFLGIKLNLGFIEGCFLGVMIYKMMLGMLEED